MRSALVTGGAGFIGSHLVDQLLSERWHITVLDSFSSFYDPEIKRANIAGHLSDPNYILIEGDIRDQHALDRVLEGTYDVIVHLAAKCGIQPSLTDPLGYQDVNVCGTQNLLEVARKLQVRQFVFASSSSVYGVNPSVPWSEDDHVLCPISPYASTKISGELLGHVYAHLYGIRFLALRFFTVYGPRQRPDLAIHKFALRMLDGKPISIYGDGRTMRDYTFVEDIVRGIRAAMDWKDTPYEVINLGNGHPTRLLDMVHALENALGRRAEIEFLPDQPGDVPQTYASIAKAASLLGYQPRTELSQGMESFAKWLSGIYIPGAR
jgi:UDP-glucuronate 4-epimerase